MNDLIQYFLFAFIICIFFILISSYFIIKKISKYQNNLYQLNSILKNLNETLEHKVNERTQELNDTIKNLTTTQKKLIEAEKLSSLGTLIAGISHEMNTPLGNSLLTATTMDNENKKIYSLFNINKISKSLLNDFLDKNNQGMNIILTNLEKTIDLVQKFKQLSIENKTVNLENINLKLFFDKFIKSSDLIKQQYTISTYIPNDIFIYSSEQNLYNIFKNLLDNSITHGFLNKKNGQIAIEAINHPESNKINIIFSDNGKGMNDDIKNKVFEPFFTTQFGKGNNGLGMNLVYNIVTSMNGEITFDSEINKGTIWIISIPIVTKTT